MYQKENQLRNFISTLIEVIFIKKPKKIVFLLLAFLIILAGVPHVIFAETKQSDAFLKQGLCFVYTESDSGTGTQVVSTSCETENYRVIVKSDSDTLPFGSVLQVSELSETSQEYQQAFDLVQQTEEDTDKMMTFSALDIGFFQNSREIEPAGAVSVSIELKNPPEADSQIAVHHIHDAEPELMASTEIRTDGQIELNENKCVASFETESFSTYTITWTRSSATFYVACNYVDESGNPLTGKSGASASVYTNQTFTPSSSDYAAAIDGYELVGIYDDDNGKAVSSITNNGRTFNWNTYAYTYTAIVTYADGTTRTVSGDKSTIALNYVYRPTVPVTIIDTVLTDGRFKAVYYGDSAGGTVSYKWYRRAAGSSDAWEEVTSEYAEDYHIPVNHTENWLNVANDRMVASADVPLYEYKAEVFVDDVSVGESAAKIVPYYDDIQNGGFEVPDVSQIASGDGGWEWNAQVKSTYTQNGVGISWKTTASDDQIELIRPSVNAESAKSAYGSQITELYDNQCAEILCSAAGALYQDILTIPGSTMYWGLQQLGRNASNTMYIVPVSTSLFTGNTIVVNGVSYDMSNQTSINSFRTAVLEKGLISGAVKATATASGWVYYNGAYTVPDNQYVTRFLFLSVAGTNNDVTMGNIIDDVKFSRDAPTPSNATAVLTIQKTVTGMSLDELNGYKVEVTAYTSDNTIGIARDGSQLIADFSDFDNPNHYTVQEDGTVIAVMSKSFVITAPENGITYRIVETASETPAEAKSTAVYYNLAGTQLNATGTDSISVTAVREKTVSVAFSNAYISVPVSTGFRENQNLVLLIAVSGSILLYAGFGIFLNRRKRGDCNGTD